MVRYLLNKAVRLTESNRLTRVFFSKAGVESVSFLTDRILGYLIIHFFFQSFPVVFGIHCKKMEDFHKSLIKLRDVRMLE